MNKKRVSIVALIIMISTVLSTLFFVQAEEVVMKKNTVDKFLLGGWVQFYDTNITSYEEQFEDLAKSGMNFVMHPDWQALQNFSSVTENLDTINKLSRKNDMYFMAKGKNPQTLVDEVTSNNYERMIFYYVADEPSAAQIPATAEAFLNYQSLDPTRSAYVNMYPNYAGSANLGGTYEDYIRNWVDTAGANNIEYLYFDHYPFTKAETVRSSYFSDLETIRKVAFENDRMKTGGFTQMGSWNGMQRPTPDMARWSVNSLLSYGMKSISHFCWVAPAPVPPPVGEGMEDFVLTWKGEKTDLYEPMQKLNWQVRQMGPTLMGIDSVHAYHTANVPKGAEELPRNYIITPNSKNDDFLISVFTTKDDSQKYMMIFNKSTENSISASFKVSDDSGINKITWLKPDDFDVLPEPGSQLNPLNEVNVGINSGEFNQTFLPGEMKLLKIDGDVVIPEPLEAPIGNLASGMYSGPQSLSLSTYQKNTEIYYTTDGSYPMPGKSGTQLYTTSYKFGMYDERKYYSIRAVCKRGEEISLPRTYEYFISDASENVARGKPVTFYNKKFDKPITAFTDNGQASGMLLTDGAHDPYNPTYLADKETGWAVIDLGAEYVIQNLVVSFWNNWEFNNVIIQTSLSANFDQANTVYNSNQTDNSLPMGNDVQYVDIFGAGKVLPLTEPTKVRYIRAYNIGAGGGVYNGRSVWQEIEAYTYLNVSDNLLLEKTSENDWQVSGGGEWKFSDNILELKETSSWTPSYTFKNKKYKNFVLEAEFKFSDIEKLGYVGFGMYKPNISDTVSEVDRGFYAIIETKGRVAAYNGITEFGDRTISVPGFNPSAAFTLRVVSAGEFFSISVNGKSIYSIRDERVNREPGYISVHGGVMPVTVSNLWIEELPDSTLYEHDQALYSQISEVKLAIKRYLPILEVEKQLPSSVTMKDTAGKLHEVKVAKWINENYNRKQTGFTTFTAVLGELNDGIVNPYNLKVTADVFIRPEVDKTDLHKLIDIVKGLNKSDYTVESWRDLLVKYDAALSIDEDEFLVQNDIGVGVFQLKAVIDALVPISSIKERLDENIKFAKSIDEQKYLSNGFDIFVAALEYANSISSLNIATQSEIDAADAYLTKAIELLQEKADLNSILELLNEIDSLSESDYTEFTYSLLSVKTAAVRRYVLNEDLSTASAKLLYDMLSDAKLSLVDKSSDIIIDKKDEGCKSSANNIATFSSISVLIAALLFNKKRIKLFPNQNKIL